jgi:hypothetical protein
VRCDILHLLPCIQYIADCARYPVDFSEIIKRTVAIREVAAYKANKFTWCAVNTFGNEVQPTGQNRNKVADCCITNCLIQKLKQIYSRKLCFGTLR